MCLYIAAIIVDDDVYRAARKPSANRTEEADRSAARYNPSLHQRDRATADLPVEF